MCKITPIGARSNFKKIILISCGVTELLRKVSLEGEGGRISPGSVGLKQFRNVKFLIKNPPQTFILNVLSSSKS